MARISFVVPVYNGACYLAETLNGLINQTVKNIEIVVVDDGSVDSIDRIKTFYVNKDDRIKWTTLDKNAGVGNARNIGNSLATSDIIAVNDSDDLSVPERARRILDVFKDDSVNIVHSGFGVINAVGEVMANNKVIPFDIQKVKETNMCYICHSTMAYRKDVALAVPYDVDKFSKLGMDDWKFEIDCYKKGYKFTPIDRELVIYRSLGSGISTARKETDCKELKELYIKEIGGLI